MAWAQPLIECGFHVAIVCQVYSTCDTEALSTVEWTDITTVWALKGMHLLCP